MSLSDYSLDLAIIKSVEFLNALDRGMSGHLPWFHGTLYDWFVSGNSMIDINDSVDNFCGGAIFVPKSADAWKEYFRNGVIYSDNLHGTIDLTLLLLHERRHSDGTGYGHYVCNSTPDDKDYDVNNLSAYGVEYWFQKSILDRFNFGIDCLDSAVAFGFLDRTMEQTNSWKYRFCYTKPPVVSMPQYAGGSCSGLTSAQLVDSFGSLPGMVVKAHNTLDDYVFATVDSDDDGLVKIAHLIGPYSLLVSSGDKCFPETAFDIGSVGYNEDKNLGSLVLNPNVLSAPNIELVGKCIKDKLCNFSLSDSHDNSVVYEIDFGNGPVSLPKDQKSFSATFSDLGSKAITTDYSCAVHGVVSAPSQLEIVVVPPDGPDLSAQLVNQIIQACTTNTRRDTTQCIIKAPAMPVVQISNIGNQKSYTSYISFYLSDDSNFSPEDQLLRQVRVQPRKPGQLQNINFQQYRLPLNSTASGKYIIAVTDSPGDVNQANNYLVFGPIQ